jgi:hypothetical protein
MFRKNKVNIIEDLFLMQPLSKDWTEWDLDFFDREGYQLNKIEKAYHEVNDVNIHTEDRMARRVSENSLDVVLQHWFTQTTPHPNIFIDHAHILHRFGFEGHAQKQLMHHANKYPKLNKLVYTTPKYGLDFAIDWIDRDQVIELFHIELDCRNYKKFVDIVSKLETFIETTDWEVIGRKFIDVKSEWIKLDEYDQAIYKAKFFGLDKIGIDYQTDHYLNKPYLFSYLKVID